jgi:hypothetical protein
MFLSRDTLCWILLCCCCSIVVQKSLSTTQQQRLPVDGPAITFVPDPFVKDLVILPRSTEYHGIVVTAMWPPPQRLMEIYSNKLLPEIKKCFDEVDLIATGNDKEASVYLYPAESLHVTIATLTPIIKRDTTKDISYYHTTNKQWSHLLEAASKHEDWPTESLQLVYDKAQIGTKAGIILWNETTGGLDKMRECLARQAGLDGLKIRNIPPIVHSTFLRFQSVPTTHGDVVQDRFATIVAPKLQDIFSLSSSSPFEASWTKMICEWSPYMHTPDDDDHVLSTVHIHPQT